ncbi:hypothetical protein L7F22_048877 [Adiantum nelumboides]|nr:hypothetical protein [Adiantum nelumboides]
MVGELEAAHPSPRGRLSTHALGDRTGASTISRITIGEIEGGYPLNDLIDIAIPREEFEVTGIYTNNVDVAMNTKNVFSSLFKAPRIDARIIYSISPSIYGREDIISYCTSYVWRVREERARDIYVLFLGDPGTTKSQFPKYVEKIAQQAVYRVGKGASIVGLTAVVHKDPVAQEWTLEGGAFVLAD